MHEASYNKKYILIGEGRLLITAREEFLDTASSKIQPRGGCIVYPIYRLEGLPNTEFCMQYTTIVSGIDQALKCILDHLWFVHYEHSPWDNISHDIHKHFQMKTLQKLIIIIKSLKKILITLSLRQTHHEGNFVW